MSLLEYRELIASRAAGRKVSGGSGKNTRGFVRMKPYYASMTRRWHTNSKERKNG